MGNGAQSACILKSRNLGESPLRELHRAGFQTLFRHPIEMPIAGLRAEWDMIITALMPSPHMPPMNCGHSELRVGVPEVRPDIVGWGFVPRHNINRSRRIVVAYGWATPIA